MNYELSMELHQIRLDKPVKISVHHRVDVAGLVLRAQVLHELVGLHHVAADLAAPFDALLGTLDLVELLAFLLQLDLVELRLQHLHGLLAVLRLRAGYLALDDDAGGVVVQAHGRLHLVDVLSAGTAAAVGVPRDVRRADLDLDVVVDDGIGEDRGERGVAPRCRVERGDAHQAVHAVLALEVAVGIGAADLDGGGLDAGHITFLTVKEFHAKVVAFGPTDVHAEEHLGPVAAFGAARAGVDVQDRVEGVLLVAHHVLELQLLHGLHGLVVGLVELRFRGVARLQELVDHLQLIIQLGGLVVVGHPRLDAADFLQQLFGGLRVVPKTVLLGYLFFFFDFLFFGIYVKDTSLAHRASLRCL